MTAPKLGEQAVEAPVRPVSFKPRPKVAPAAPVAAPVSPAAPVAGAVPAPRPEAAVPAARPAPVGERPARKRGRRTTAASQIEDNGTSVYLTIGLRDRLKAARAARPGSTYTDIVLDAIEATEGRLGELLAARAAPRRSGPMFAGRTQKLRRLPEDQVQVTIRPSLGDLAIIDALKAAHGAPNRSALITEALDAYLPG